MSETGASTAAVAAKLGSIFSRRNALLALGVTPGAHVAVMLPNVPAYAITWLALARLGAVMVPVNMQYKSRELEYVLRDSDATFLVIDENASSGILTTVVPRRCLSQFRGYPSRINLVKIP